MEQNLIYIFRLVIACICGITIGWERENRAKDAGTRTHCVVSCAACLIMIISKYGFSDLPIGAFGSRGADPARIAAQIVSGIGFLGAGMVFIKHQSVSGLTTAAGIWATAGIGMAIGSGMYVIGVASTVLIFLVHTILHFRVRMNEGPRNKMLTVKSIENADIIKEKFQENNITVHDTNIVKKNGSFTYVFYIEIPYSLDEEEFLRSIPYDCALKSEL